MIISFVSATESMLPEIADRCAEYWDEIKNNYTDFGPFDKQRAIELGKESLRSNDMFIVALNSDKKILGVCLCRIIRGTFFAGPALEEMVFHANKKLPLKTRYKIVDFFLKAMNLFAKAHKLKQIYFQVQKTNITKKMLEKNGYEGVEETMLKEFIYE